MLADFRKDRKLRVLIFSLGYGHETFCSHIRGSSYLEGHCILGLLSLGMNHGVLTFFSKRQGRQAGSLSEFFNEITRRLKTGTHADLINGQWRRF